jgi:DNA-binding beta-propeller fold protein YncE
MKVKTCAILILTAGVVWSLGMGGTMPQTAAPLPLEVEAKIPLGEVSGRIDHMALDFGRHRLFVAELGNNSVGVIDLAERKLVHRISGLREPQGVAYLSATNTVYVANAGDGSLRLFNAESFAETGRIDLGADADNIRVDTQENRLLVGYGSGGLAVIDPGSQRKVADIALTAHPEAFQLDRRSNRVFVNLPDSRTIAVVDRSAGKQMATWSTGGAGGNFPMAIDFDTGRVLVVFRSPARLGVFSSEDGKLIASVDTCGDGDDVFVDAKRQRIYVSCGEGYIDVFGTQDGYPRTARIPTAPGARTSLFVPELDRLMLAVRARFWSEPAAVWVYRPTP